MKLSTLLLLLTLSIPNFLIATEQHIISNGEENNFAKQGLKKLKSIDWKRLDKEVTEIFNKYARPVVKDLWNPTLQEAFRFSHIFDKETWNWENSIQPELQDKLAMLVGVGAAFALDKTLKNLLEKGVSEKHIIKQLLWHTLFSFWGTHISEENLGKFLLLTTPTIAIWTFLNTSRDKEISEAAEDEKERIRSIPDLFLRFKRAFRNVVTATTAIGAGYFIRCKKDEVNKNSTAADESTAQASSSTDE
ncbi:hypothetical protein KAU11_04910 [Candidatus Babeliales bacterium]|nr:hypothetical protein [Candidatus Babeliales bacterium]